MTPVEMVRRGFRRIAGRSEPMATVPQLGPDRVFVVTGASSGVGAETARGLARAGATVVLVGRNPERTEAVCQDIAADTGNPHVGFELADFARQSEVRALAERLRVRLPALHGLVNNAGVWHPDRRVGPDGYEDTFAVNHLAPFLLTHLLRDRLVTSAPARITTVSSRLHASCPAVDLDDPFYVRRRYRGMAAYAQSKLANLLFAFELARRLEGTGVTSTAVHPGDVATGVVRDTRLLTLGMELVRPLLLTPWEGAQTSLHAIASTEAEGRNGAYFSFCAEADPAPQATDPAAAAALWERSLQLVGEVG